MRVLAGLVSVAAADPRADLKQAALAGVADSQREVIAFLVDHMPVRIAGTAMWTTREGNHNWVEVWLPEAGKWRFTEYGANGRTLDQGWLLGEAARGIPGSVVHGIYATSWQPTGHHFPLVWNMRDTSVPGVDVTNRYVELGAKNLPAPEECELRVESVVKEVAGKRERAPLAVEVRQGDVVVEKGTTPGPGDDLNRFFTAKVKQGFLYQVLVLRDGQPVTVERLSIGKDEATKRVTLEVPAKR